jgi:hypothetical protein
VALAVSEPVDCDPLVGLEPFQVPLAVQEVALVTDHVSVELLPAVIDEGLALRITVGAVADVVTVTLCEALPPGPVHVRA